MAEERPVVRPDALSPTGEVNPGAAIIVDQGATVNKATPLQVVDAAIPLATQAEAEAGTDNNKRVTPLRVKQAIDAQSITLDALSIPGGASLIGFEQDGAGVQSRTVKDKVSEVLSIDDLDGVVGDGVNDDGAAINAALFARYGGLSGVVNNDVIVIHGTTGKTYRFATGVTVRQARIRLIGNGARVVCDGIDVAFDITQDGTGNHNVDAEVSDWIIEGAGEVAIRAQGAPFFRAVGNQITNGNAGIDVIACVEPLIEGNHVRNNTEFGLRLRADSQGNECQRALITRNRLWGSGTYGLHCIDGLGYWIDGNDFEVNEVAQVYLQSSGGHQFGQNYSEPVGGSIVVLQDNVAGTALNRTSDSNDLGSWFLGGGADYDFHLKAGHYARIGPTRYGTGNVRIDSDCAYTLIEPVIGYPPTVTDAGDYTIDRSTHGRTSWRVGANARLEIDAYALGGAQIGSRDGLLDIYGLHSLGAGSTPRKNLTGYVDISDNEDTGSVTFATPEPDSLYNPFLSLWDLSNSADCDAVKIIARDSNGFQFRLDAPPGSGKTVRVHWFLLGA